MTKTQQQAHLYDPIVEELSENWQAIQDFPAALQALFSRKSEPLTAQQRRSLKNVGRMFASVVVLVAGLLLIRHLRRRSRQRAEDGDDESRADYVVPPTPWYDRFLTLAAERLGRRREAARTHREYADDVGVAAGELKPVAETATDEYYRVRFGRKAPRDDRLRAVASQLDALQPQPGRESPS